MTKKCDYCVYRNTLECKKSPVPKDLICDDFMLDICALSNKEQIAIQKMLIEEYRDTITRNQNFFDMAIEALDKQDVSEINVGDMIDLQFLQPESEYVFYDSDHGFCINTQDVLDCLRKELRNG